MSSPHGEISHVSDTALMVAACRAFETEDPEGFVRDPFAARLAGERGMAIFAGLPHPEVLRLVIGVRSRFLDDLLLETLASFPVSTVVSLGCGLDTRPWRLHLPPELRWMEVDFPEMLDYKEAQLSSDAPHCRRERLSADLNDAAQRRTLYEAIGPDPALLITEGLMMYLPAATVDSIASEVGELSGVRHWICDITTTAASTATNMTTLRSVRQVQAPDALPGEKILAAIESHGWHSAACRSYITDMGFAMERVMRMFAASGRTEGPPRVALDDRSGVHRFTRAGADV